MTDDKESWAAHVSRTMEDLKPRKKGPLSIYEIYCPWENNRPSGCTLKQALFEMVPQEREAISLHLAKVATGIETEVYTRGIQQRCWHFLLQRLQESEVTMRGIANGQVESIPAVLFDNASPDFDANQITCGGRRFVGVRIFEANPEPSEELSKRNGRPTSSFHYMSEMRDRAGRGELAQGVGAEARYLKVWLKRNHPNAPQPSASAIENAIRIEYKALKPSQKK